MGQLGANSYRTRERATRRLMEAGSSVLPILAAAKSTDLEVTARMQHIRESLLGAKAKYDRKDTLALSLPDSACLAVHPDGVHWAAIEGEYARAKIVLGEIRNEKLKVLRKIEDPHMPTVLRFGRSGDLYVGNRNGTVSRYGRP